MKYTYLIAFLLLLALACDKKETKEQEVKSTSNKEEIVNSNKAVAVVPKNSKSIVAYSTGYSQASSIKQQLQGNKFAQDIQKNLVQAIKDAISNKQSKYLKEDISKAEEKALNLSILRNVKSFIDNNQEHKKNILKSLSRALDGMKNLHPSKKVENAKVLSNYTNIYDNLPKLNLSSKEEKEEFLSGMSDGVEGKAPKKSQKEIQKAQQLIASAGQNTQALLANDKPEIKEAKIIMAYLSGYQISQLSQISDKEKQAFLNGAKDFIANKENRYSKDELKKAKKILLESYSYELIENIAKQVKDKKEKVFADIKKVIAGKNFDESSNVEGTLAYSSFYQQIKEFVKDFNKEQKQSILKGFQDALAGKKSIYTEAETQASFTAYQNTLEQKFQKSAEKDKKNQSSFLEKNAKKNGVETTKSGLQYKIIKKGTGKSPIATDKVEVHYEGKLIDGTVFDSSYKRKETASFPLNGVISGWIEGLQLMKEGAIYEFYIPYNLAYGEKGQGAIIPPYATLVFKVELIKIIK